MFLKFGYHLERLRLREFLLPNFHGDSRMEFDFREFTHDWAGLSAKEFFDLKTQGFGTVVRNEDAGIKIHS